jgi:hypothetical protein
LRWFNPRLGWLRWICCVHNAVSILLVYQELIEG